MEMPWRMHAAGRPRRCTSRLVAAGAAGVALLLGAGENRAVAGVYKMYSCNVPGKTAGASSASPWRPLLDSENTRYFDRCAAGEGFGLGLDPQQPSMGRGRSAGVELRRPEQGPKSAIGIVGYRTWIDADFSGAFAFIEVGGAFSPPGGSTPDASPWVSPAFATSNPAVYVLLYCASGEDACRFNNTRPMAVRGVESDLYEAALPTGTLDGGTLLAGQAMRGSRTVSFTASDEESGVAKIEFLLGNSVVATEDLQSDPASCPHVDWAACPSQYGGHFSIDTSQLAAGDYVGTLRVTDAAGNRRTIKHAGVITVVKEAASGTTTTVSADRSSRLTAQFASNSRSSYTTSFGHSVRIRGRLTDDGRPVANAALVVTERYDSGVRATTTKVLTGADGKYGYRASGRRPSRRIDVHYPGPVGAPAASASRRLRLLVRAAATLRVGLRGITVAYRGRVIAGPVPRGGKKIYVQGRAKGGVWQRFATRRTDASGAFAGRYRLRVRRPGVRLQFRIEIPRQAGYPYVARLGLPIGRTVR